jgi:hypothetical protein
MDMSRTVLAVRESLGDRYDRIFDDAGSILSAKLAFARLADTTVRAPNSTALRRNLRSLPRINRSPPLKRRTPVESDCVLV